MKIIAKSNFNDEMVSDLLIAENITEIYAKKIAGSLNVSDSGPYHPHYYEAVEDGYELYVFQP